PEIAFAAPGPEASRFAGAAVIDALQAEPPALTVGAGTLALELPEVALAAPAPEVDRLAGADSGHELLAEPRSSSVGVGVPTTGTAGAVEVPPAADQAGAEEDGEEIETLRREVEELRAREVAALERVQELEMRLSRLEAVA